MAVVTDVTFSFREPPSKSRRTVADIRKMSARQHVSCCFYMIMIYMIFVMLLFIVIFVNFLSDW